jgi:hypothetical protein
MHQSIAASSLRLFLWLPLLLLAGCGDNPDFDPAQLAGRWEIAEAYRNGELTTSLEDLFLDFDGQETLSTNLTSAEREFQYSVDGNQIYQSGGPMNVTYQIEELTEQRLILTTTLRNYDFRFVFIRPAPAE